MPLTSWPDTIYTARSQELQKKKDANSRERKPEVTYSSALSKWIVPSSCLHKEECVFVCVEQTY